MTTSLTRSSDTQASAYDIIMRAVADQSCDPAKLKALLDVRREWNADEAAQEFNAAVVKFQQRVAIIAKLDKAYDKMYARMDRIWREIRPLLDECGLAVTWESVKTTAEGCTLDGHLRHTRGHAQPLHHEMPLPDLLKGQNAAQRAGSAETYAKRYALMAALGIQVGDDNDGGTTAPQASAKAIAAMRATLAANGRDEAKACQFIGVKSLDDANADQLLQLATTMAQPAKRAPALPPAGAHVPTRAESLAAIAAASAIRRTAALKSRDLTPDNYTSAPDDILAEVAGMLRGGE